ncbi:MAG: iron-sulfur cluster carrier protein ApbC [Woeseia sp.]|nr:iron-sulfur cluster carrier protein ApbC [Woeseia sp.]
MTVPTKSDIRNALKTLTLPLVGRPIVEVGKVIDVTVNSDGVSVTIELGFPALNLFADIVDAITAHMKEKCSIDAINVEVTSKVTAHGVQRNLKPLPNVRNVIAVASGKGGVGKSTTAVNLALALATNGASIGILDADIYGPSIPLMLGVSGMNPTSEDGQSMEPIEAHDIQLMSIGFLIDSDQPMAWRGPMVTQALNQMLQQTQWNDLDYLIVDMPPGTGDIQLTLSQQVPVSGAVIVTTPQDIALLDARKGLQMFRKVSVPVLGIVENMSTYICEGCGREEPLFGRGGGEQMALEYDVELLGQLPLDLTIREQTDSGRPCVIADPEGGPAISYNRTAMRMAAGLAVQGKDYSSKFPNIVIENS